MDKHLVFLDDGQQWDERVSVELFQANPFSLHLASALLLEYRSVKMTSEYRGMGSTSENLFFFNVYFIKQIFNLFGI